MALAMAGIRASGTEEQKKRWLPEFTNPDKLVLGGLGLTEPDSGSDALSMKTRATRVSDGYVLNGTKQFCTNGGIADYHVIYANTDPSKGPAGIASFLVPKGTPGLRMGRKEQKLGVRASHTAQVILEDCHIPLDHRLGGEPDADNAGPGALGALDDARGDTARRGRGRARHRASRIRVRAGLRAGSQAVRQAAVAARGHRFQARRHGDEDRRRAPAHLARRLDGHAGPRRLSAPRDRWRSASPRDVAMEVTTDAIQVLGGYGYIKEYPVEKWFRDAKIYQIWEGTAEIQRLVISRAIAGSRGTIRSCRG